MARSLAQAKDVLTVKLWLKTVRAEVERSPWLQGAIRSEATKFIAVGQGNSSQT